VTFGMLRVRLNAATAAFTMLAFGVGAAPKSKAPAMSDSDNADIVAFLATQK
jgi:hypothetical protein